MISTLFARGFRSDVCGECPAYDEFVVESWLKRATSASRWDASARWRADPLSLSRVCIHTVHIVFWLTGFILFKFRPCLLGILLFCFFFLRNLSRHVSFPVITTSCKYVASKCVYIRETKTFWPIHQRRTISDYS